VTEPVLLRRMVDDLVASGELVPQWREAFASVPRHLFIPNLVWWEDNNVVGGQ
jgi:protein-L-isoaspartate O-methyltransferase